MRSNEEYCPQCPNHCHKNELMCGRGETYFGGGEKHGSNINHQRLFGIAGLLKECGHLMHHNPEIDNERLCQGLSEEEKTTLEDLLKKILSNVK